MVVFTTGMFTYCTESLYTEVRLGYINTNTLKCIYCLSEIHI